MTIPMEHKYSLPQLKHLASNYANNAKPGDVFLLHGPMGAGKTAFSKFFINALYPNALVTSPTFCIVQYYDQIAHFDLYRIADESELYELNVAEDLLQKICLIEWPENLFSLKSQTAIEIFL